MGAIAERILHVDMDAFFVEVERLRRPELRGAPVIVGGLGNRGVVSAASYEARRRGVHSAMPMAEARRRCPHALYLPPDHRAYRAMSERVFAIFAEFSPIVEGVSLDEAFIDIGGLGRHYPAAGEVAEEVRRRLRSELGLPASAGAATSKFVAKLASEAAKPDGAVVVPAGKEVAFLHPLGVRALWGVGEATHAALESLGIETIGDLAHTPSRLLERRLGAAVGARLAQLAWGRDDRPVEAGAAAKSISVEQTYEEDLTDAEQVEGELLRHCDRLARRLRAAGYAARTLTLKVRFASFATITRHHTVGEPLSLAADIHEAVARLAGDARLGAEPIRLLGVGASSLVPSSRPQQLHLTGASREALAEASDAVRDRFGEGALQPARLVRRGDTSRRQRHE